MIYYADENWSPLNDNPFSCDGHYDENWSAFIYDVKVEYYTNIFEGAKVYTLRVSPKIDFKYERLLDFVCYEVGYKRNIIIKVIATEKRYIKKIIDELQCDNSTIVRVTDPKWMVHSTTKELWKSIEKTGSLLSPSELRKRNIVVSEIGLKSLMEPKDYSDYIMLDSLNGCGEIVVNSRQLGYVCVDADVPYNPGVRLYFDAHRIIEDGLATRDGLHLLKVKKELPLERYLKSVVEKDLLEPKEVFTPTIFTEMSNNYFLDSVKL
nr:hypothetical protein [Sedimentibacter sp.]